MRIALHVCSGPATGQRIVLRRGQAARFGKTDWADYAFAADAHMADVHFEVHCVNNAYALRSLNAAFPTHVNNQPVTTIALANGDVIRAGQSEFQVILDEMLGEGPAPQALQAIAEAPLEDLPKLAQLYGLSEEGVAATKACRLAAEVPKKLVAEQLVLDAVRWQAHRLPKPQAVAWACQCVKELPNFEQLPDIQRQAIATAEAWSQSPTEANRLAAAQMIDDTEVEGVGGALSVAAGWSGGSLAPEGQEVVPPDEMLTGRAVFTALLLTSYLGGQPNMATGRMRAYLDQAPTPRPLAKSGD